MQNIDRIKIDNKELILIGTAHVSKKSIDLVNETIEKEKPDVVGVELCQSRYKALTDKKKWQNTKITQIIKEGNSYLFLTNLLLGVFQRKLGANLEIAPGSEMIAAIKKGKEQNAKIELLDRDVQITLKRAWSQAKMTEKVKLIYGLAEGLILAEEVDVKIIEEMKAKDMMSHMIEDLSKQMPGAKKVLIDERDCYLANKILSAEGKKIIAVVGAGHVEGIKKHLKKKKDISSLEKIPKKSKLLKTITYAIPVMVIGIMLAGFMFHKSPDIALSMIWYWILINGGLSAFAVLFALPHPLTVISVFIAAPFTSLNPTIGAGIIGGYVEAKTKEPKVSDFENLNQITTINGFWKNRISRILLVVSFANVGSSIATFIALPVILSLL
ncbi:MAG: TraB/GumN family protein [Candidatus Aenigmarchaeota archaeon]|nr:TraB/GumN family protein [Candidatus Aenigmarchaeota archaeon]